MTAAQQKASIAPLLEGRRTATTCASIHKHGCMYVCAYLQYASVSAELDQSVCTTTLIHLQEFAHVLVTGSKSNRH